MEEIQVGEYFRTKEGMIFKANEYWVAENSEFQAKHPENYTITKHSFNIVDLIEVGDYVNGYKVLYNCNETEKEQCNGEYRKCIIVATGKTGEWKMVDWDIESIVTREQFENMKYVVGDK